MADDFDDFIADLDDNTLQNSALSLSKLLALDEDYEDGGFEKLLGKLNDKDLEDIIDLDTLEQLEKDFMADEQISSGDSPDQPSESPPLKVQKRKHSPEPGGKRPPKGKGKRVPEEEPKYKEPEKVYCICRQPQNNRFMICCDSCEEWYHGDCVGISLERGRQMEKASEDYTCSKCQKAKEKPAPQAHIPSSLREKAKSLKVATVVPTKHYSADTKYNRFDNYDHVDRSTTKCKIEGCPEYAMRNSPFCSEKCVLKFAQDNMKGTTTTKIKTESSDRQDIRGYEEKKLSQPNPLRLTVRKHLKTLLSTRAKEATDLLVTEDEIVKIAQNIEMSLYKLYPDCGNRYKAKCKAICFNISDSKNVNLYRNILSGTLSSEKLAKMTPEEMSVRVKAKQLQVNPASSAAALDSTVNIMDMLGDTTSQHGTHVFDVKCRKCTGKVAKQKEPKPPPKPNPETDPYAEPVPNRLALSAKPLKDPLGLNPALWKGYITMTSLTKFATSGYHVYGPHESLLSTLPDTLHVQGRIANNIVWAYVDRLRNSPVKELIILKFESQNGEEVQGYSNLFHYLHTRTRCGVIGNVTAPVRDMYLVPLSAEGSIPPQLRLLGVSSIPKKNRTNLILGLIVVNKVGAKRPREPQVEPLNPDQDQDPPPSRDTNTPGSLEHLSSFPTDVSLPFNLGGGSCGGDGAEDDGAASDDDGINDIDLILRNNLPLRGTLTTDGAAHCRGPAFSMEDFTLPDTKPEVVSNTLPPEVKVPPATDNTPYNGMVDGKPILSPLTPLAPPSLSFHPEEGTPLSVPPVYNTDYSPVSPATKHAFLNPPPASNTSSQFDNFNSPAATPYTNPPSNFSSHSSTTNYYPTKFSYPGTNTPGSNPQTPQSVYPSIQEPPLNKLDHQKLPDFSAMSEMKNMMTPQNDMRMVQPTQAASNMMVPSPAHNQTIVSPGMMGNVNVPVNNSPNGLVNTNSVNNSNVYTLVQTNVQTCVQRTEIQQLQQQQQQQQQQLQQQQLQQQQFQQQQNGMLSQRQILPQQNGMCQQNQMLRQQHPTTRQQSPMSGQQNFMALQQSQALQQKTIKQRQQQMKKSPLRQVQPNFMPSHPNLLQNQQAKLMAQHQPNAPQNQMLKNIQTVAPPNQMKTSPQAMTQYAQMPKQAPRLQFPGQQQQQRHANTARQILPGPAPQGHQRQRMLLPRQLSPLPPNQETADQSQYSQIIGQNQGQINQMMASSKAQVMAQNQGQVMVQNQGQVMAQNQNQVLAHNQMMSPGFRMMSNQQMSKVQSVQQSGPAPNQPLQLSQTLRPQVKGGARPQAQVVQNILGIRAQRMAAQQQALLRQAGSPVKGGGPISSVQGGQNIYLSQQPHTFMVTDNRQPVAMAQQMRMSQPRFGNGPMIYPNQNGIVQQDFSRSPNKSAKTTAKRSAVKQKLKSKISNKGLAPKVKKAPKMFDGDSLLAQLEDVT